MKQVAQFDVPKVYSTAINAKTHHSGYNDVQNEFSQENSYYTRVENISENESPVMF